MTVRTLCILIGQPLNDLFFAINHYVSTGDHVGEGVAHEIDRHRVRVLIPVRKACALDQQNFARFRERFDELAEDFCTSLSLHPTADPFDIWTFTIESGFIEAMAAALRERPGPRGWGSPKQTIDFFTLPN